MQVASVPIPDRLKGNKRDRRGYPIPYIVARDKKNKPLFIVNDPKMVKRCLDHNRCGLCGDKLLEVICFVGGPAAALHPQGAYIDPPMHEECVKYALQVCPFLAFSAYNGAKEAYVDKLDNVVTDIDAPSGKPKLFILKYTHGFVNMREYLTPRLVPNDTINMEFWKDGKQLSEDDPFVWDTIKGTLELVEENEDRNIQSRSPAMTSLVAYGR